MNVVLPCNSKVRWEKSQFILVGVSTTLKWFTVNFSPCLRKQLKLLERLNLKYPLLGNSLEVQWLGLYTFTAKGCEFIPGGRTKMPQVTRCGEKKKQGDK